MSRWIWRAGGIAIGLAFLASLVLLTEAPARFSTDDTAMLRLSWRLPSGEGEDCRRPTQQELAELPAHMRNPDACIGGSHPGFMLSVRLDGADLVTDTLYPAGSRGDRPIFVFRELLIESGRRALRVRFEENASGRADGSATRRVLEWEDEVDLEPREIVLVRYDQDTRTLQAVRGD